MATELTDFTGLLREHAKQSGVDILGIAPISRFADLPREKHPAIIFPEVQSVLIIGKRITRGALRGIEEGTQFDLYVQYGRDWLSNRVLATATFKTAEFLEEIDGQYRLAASQAACEVLSIDSAEVDFRVAADVDKIAQMVGQYVY